MLQVLILWQMKLILNKLTWSFCGFFFYQWSKYLWTSLWQNLAGLEAFDVANILTQQGGEAVYPLPRIKDLLIHSKLNLAICLLTVYINAFWNRMIMYSSISLNWTFLLCMFSRVLEKLKNQEVEVPPSLGKEGNNYLLYSKVQGDHQAWGICDIYDQNMSIWSDACAYLVYIRFDI